MGKKEGEAKPKAKTAASKPNDDAKLIREFLRFKADKVKTASPKKKKATTPILKKLIAQASSKKEKVSDAEIASFLKLKQLCEQEGSQWKDE